MSTDVTETFSLRFDSENDSINYASHLVEDGNNWLSANNLNLIERYEREEIELVVKTRGVAGSWTEGGNFDLVFVRVPDRTFRDLEVSIRGCNVHGGTQAARTHSCDDSMLISDCYPIECPKKVISSLVWLERPKERKDLIRDILAATASRFVKISGTTEDRKVSMLRVCPPAGHGDFVPGVVECGSHIIDGIADNLVQTARQGPDKFDLENDMVGALRIRLTHFCVWISVKEGHDLPIEISDVFF